jgi:hypothetical protein
MGLQEQIEWGWGGSEKQGEIGGLGFFAKKRE